MERLQRVLAARGVASRRKAEELITSGRVRVDGKIVRELGVQVDPERQKIEVDGKLLPIFRHRYILLNKPSGYITTTADERDRRTVMDLVQVSEPVVPVGRLDRPTEGLLLLTNDGDVAYRITHPRFEVDKEYEALLDGHPPASVLERVRRGIVIDGERATPSSVRPIKNLEEGTVVRIVLHEGRNRVVRRMFEEVGYPVLKLVRTRIGPLQLGTIPRGQWRDITDGELEQLREALRLGDEDVATAQRQERGRPSRPQQRPQGDRRPSAPRDDQRPGRRPDQRERPAAQDRRGPRPDTQRDQRGRPDQRRDRPEYDRRERSPRESYPPGSGRRDSRPRSGAPPQRDFQPRDNRGAGNERAAGGPPRRPQDARRDDRPKQRSDERPPRQQQGRPDGRSERGRPQEQRAPRREQEVPQRPRQTEQRPVPQAEPERSAAREREVEQRVPRVGARKVRGSAHTIIRTRDRKPVEPDAT